MKKQQFRGFSFYIILILIVVLVWYFLSSGQNRVPTGTYDQFKNDLAANKIVSAEISQNEQVPTGNVAVVATDNAAVTDRPLAVNCAGRVHMEHAFSTDNPAGRNDFYLQYMAGGEMDVTLPEGRVVMREGDAILYVPHTHYRYESRTGASYYWVHFSGSEAALLMRECGFENGRVMAVGVHERLRSGFERMFSEFISRDEFFELSLSASLTKLCLELARLRASAAEPRPASDDRIDRVLAKIHRAYDKPLSIAALAAEEFLSESRLRVLFRQRTGMSPAQYGRVHQK